jgi:hypothetical protein
MTEHLMETILGRKLRKLYNHSGWEINKKYPNISVKD